MLYPAIDYQLNNLHLSVLAISISIPTVAFVVIHLSRCILMWTGVGMLYVDWLWIIIPGSFVAHFSLYIHVWTRELLLFLHSLDESSCEPKKLYWTSCGFYLWIFYLRGIHWKPKKNSSLACCLFYYTYWLVLYGDRSSILLDYFDCSKHRQVSGWIYSFYFSFDWVVNTC